jgi:hypothetical protein
VSRATPSPCHSWRSARSRGWSQPGGAGRISGGSHPDRHRQKNIHAAKSRKKTIFRQARQSDLLPKGHIPMGRVALPRSLLLWSFEADLRPVSSLKQQFPWPHKLRFLADRKPGVLQIA